MNVTFRRLSVLLLVLALGIPAASGSQASQAAPSRKQAAPEAMTNADVVKMAKAGLGDEIVAAAIRKAVRTAFDLSADGLIALKGAGVSETVLSVMIDPAKPDPETAPAPARLPAAVSLVSPSTASVEGREAGIYLEESGTLSMIEPTVFTGAKTGGLWKSALTYGIAKANWKAVVRSPRAALRVATPQPVFLFYFESSGAGLSNTGAFSALGSGASSPNEFVLARMSSKKNEREIIVGESGITGFSTGTRSKDAVPFVAEKLQTGVYKVTLAEPLEPGEYCFFYAAGSSMMMAAGTGKLFDFGVDAPSTKTTSQR